MASADATGVQLVEDTVRALEALSSHLDSPDDLQLQLLGVHVQRMLESYREVLGFAVQRRRIKSYPSAQIGRIFRVVIVFSTYFSLMSGQIKTAGADPQSWGAHVFSENEFSELGFDRFEPPGSAEAISFLLGDTAADLLEALEALQIRSTPAASYAIMARAETAISAVLSHFPPAKLGDRLTMPVWSFDRVITELGIDTAGLDSLITGRRILSVPIWAGGVRFPIFQFDLAAKVVKAPIAHAVQNVSDDFTGWPLAIWLQHNENENPDFFETALSDYGLWAPAWSKVPTNVYKNVKGNPVNVFHPAAPLFRVARTGYSPFWFATIPASAPNGGRAGRFDIPTGSTTRLGTLYVAEQQEGAWREVLERVPTITLRNLLGRTLWELRFNQDMLLGTVVTNSLGLSTEHRRSDTQLVAERLAQRSKAGDMQGFEYPLRTGAAQIGIALFGPAGSTLPESADLGVWTADSLSELDSDGLWTYLKDRRRDEPSNPIRLRRFPTEITLPKRA